MRSLSSSCEPVDSLREPILHSGKLWTGPPCEGLDANAHDLHPFESDENQKVGMNPPLKVCIPIFTLLKRPPLTTFAPVKAEPVLDVRAFGPNLHGLQDHAHQDRRGELDFHLVEEQKKNKKRFSIRLGQQSATNGGTNGEWLLARSDTLSVTITLQDHHPMTELLHTDW